MSEKKMKVQVSCSICGKQFWSKTLKFRDEGGKKIFVPERTQCRLCENRSRMVRVTPSPREISDEEFKRMIQRMSQATRVAEILQRQQHYKKKLREQVEQLSMGRNKPVAVKPKWKEEHKPKHI